MKSKDMLKDVTSTLAGFTLAKLCGLLNTESLVYTIFHWDLQPYNSINKVTYNYV